MDIHTDYYRATLPSGMPSAPLEGDVETDVCIVGGGFAGLNTALGLVERGCRDVLLLEAQQVGHGASGRNGGFVFGGFSRGEKALLDELGAERAARLYRASLDAVELIRTRIARYGIACDATYGGVLWANWFRDPTVLRRRQQLLRTRFDTGWDWIDREELRSRVRTSRYHDALLERQAFHFHPLKYAHGLAQAVRRGGGRLHESSPATALHRDGAGWQVRTPRGSVRARHVVLACGGYLAGLDRAVDAGVLPIATYVMVTEPLGPRLREVLRTDAAVYDTRFAFDYYRPLPDSRLLWGGRISVLDRAPSAVRRLLRRDMLKVFPQLEDVRVEHAWSGLMSYARHQMPQIGEVEPGLWLAQAFGGHGVAPTAFAGEQLAAAILSGEGCWPELGRYPLVPAFKPAGYVAAQLSYWWAQAKDALKDVSERRPGDPWNAR
ncbi:MAG TPA: FAD-binding oxidoreductase [Lysobacter sp.]